MIALMAQLVMTISMVVTAAILWPVAQVTIHILWRKLGMLCLKSSVVVLAVMI